MSQNLTRAKNWSEGGKGGHLPLQRSSEIAPYTRQPLTHERKASFLIHLETHGDVAKAAMLTDGNPNTRRTFMRAMAKDSAFGKAAEDALAAFSTRVGDVMRQEFFEGTMVPVVNKDGIVQDKDGNEVWIRKRDPKIVLALAKKHDFGLREIKTTVNIDAGNPNAADPNDPQFIVKASDLNRLSQPDMEALTGLLRKVYDGRREAMAEITDRPDYLDAEDVQYTDITPDPDNPFDI